MRVKLLQSIAGSFQGRHETLWDKKRGDVVDLDETHAWRQIAAGRATADLKKNPLPPPLSESDESRDAMIHPLLVADRERNKPPVEHQMVPERHVGRRPGF